MKKKLFIALILTSAFLIAGCGESKKESKSETAQEAPAAPAEEVIAESSEESGEIEAENTAEETGEVVDEFSIESSMETDKDALIARLSAEKKSGMVWKYTITDESVIALESDEYIDATEEGGTDTQQFLFRAKQAGESLIGLDYLAPDEEPEADGDEEAWHDVTVRVTVADDLTITFTEE